MKMGTNVLTFSCVCQHVEALKIINIYMALWRNEAIYALLATVG